MCPVLLGALRVLKDIADSDCEDYPDVRSALESQTYMDDICADVESVVKAKMLKDELIEVLSRSGLSLKKWSSNSLEVSKDVPI